MVSIASYIDQLELEEYSQNYHMAVISGHPMRHYSCHYSHQNKSKIVAWVCLTFTPSRLYTIVAAIGEKTPSVPNTATAIFASDFDRRDRSRR